VFLFFFMDLRLSHWISHKYPLLTLSLIDSSWNCLTQIISKLSSIVSMSSVSVYEVSLWLVTPKTFQAKLDSVTVWESSCQKTLAYVSCYTLWYNLLPMYLSSRESICVSDCMCVRTAVCLLVKLYIIFNYLI